MKKIFLFCFVAFSLSAMVRASVDVEPNQPAPVYYNEWYGPGIYYGIYFNDYPTYYAWQREHYYGGPYYYRHNHPYHYYNNYPYHGGGHHH
jgi:hypothetical protein